MVYSFRTSLFGKQILCVRCGVQVRGNNLRRYLWRDATTEEAEEFLAAYKDKDNK